MIWCYRIDCKYCSKGRRSDYAVDRDGKFGECKFEEVIIDRNGKCKSEETKDIDNDFDMLREKQDYSDSVKSAGGFDKDCPIGDEENGEY